MICPIVLYSAGTDGLLKAASSTTGQVHSKIIIPYDARDTIDPPTLLHALSPQTLLLATDSAALHLFDMRIAQNLSGKPSQTHRPHDDYISSLTPLPPSDASTSGFSKQWVTTGGTTLAVTDLRRGVLVKSEDQEEELLSSVYVSGLRARPGGSKGEKVVVGSSAGVLTLWEKGVWDDQDERIIVDGAKGGGESLDVMVMMPDGVGDGGKNIVVGVGDGTVRIVKIGVNKVVGESLRHDDVESVVGLGFDVGGRLISGGGSIVKVWQEKMNLDDEGDEWESDSDADSDDDGGVEEAIEEDVPEEQVSTKKRELEVETKDEDNSDADSSDEESNGGKRRKKRRKSKKSKTDIGNGILKFKGM